MSIVESNTTKRLLSSPSPKKLRKKNKPESPDTLRPQFEVTVHKTMSNNEAAGSGEP